MAATEGISSRVPTKTPILSPNPVLNKRQVPASEKDDHLVDVERKKKMKLEQRKLTLSRRLSFSKFVDSKEESPGTWLCCGENFRETRDIHKHVSVCHSEEINSAAEEIYRSGSTDSRWKILQKEEEENEEDDGLPRDVGPDDVYPWLPCYHSSSDEANCDGRILLYYKYRWLSCPEHVYNWQKELCRRLQLTGKIRVAKEGINATVGGSTAATEVYIQAVLSHPLFSNMTREDFKTSPGNAACFPNGIRVGVFAEICPLGIAPETLPFTQTATHLSPEDWHQAMSSLVENQANQDAVLIDCRNFYESKIGTFEGALRPDIRKFSYFPEYVDENLEEFKDKKIYMYCTGGIRCERGSAYLKHKGIKEVYQLQGGIHKYMEKYPDGHYRGKLFVFDDRYAISSNDDVISECFYCSAPWDQYKPCSSPHCHQLVLICPKCLVQDLTACCRTCQSNADRGRHREECECTAKRPRIPVENVGEPQTATSPS